MDLPFRPPNAVIASSFCMLSPARMRFSSFLVNPKEPNLDDQNFVFYLPPPFPSPAFSLVSCSEAWTGSTTRDGPDLQVSYRRSLNFQFPLLDRFQGNFMAVLRWLPIFQRVVVLPSYSTLSSSPVYNAVLHVLPRFMVFRDLVHGSEPTCAGTYAPSLVKCHAVPPQFDCLFLFAGPLSFISSTPGDLGA